ncbi:MAG: sigma-54-dependent Fis family transcriptional regulator [Deltaproteobacteria bacterium]|nr:sigma-54-dependent Fis family transcriptional regulator [Deltaproteobacteria bacterium]
MNAQANSQNGFVLVIDDERLLAQDLAYLLTREGYQTEVASSVAETMACIPRFYPDVVLMDLCLPDGDGSETMAKLKNYYPEMEFIMITAHGSIPSAVDSTRWGAFGYLTKPVEPAEILFFVRQALDKKQESEALRTLRRRVAGNMAARMTAPDYPSAAVRRIVSLAQKAAAREGNVLMLGESGTGKDHWARWIHCHSARRDGPYFSLNCATLSRELADSELFGHEPGAFTGSRGRKRGMLEMAGGGTLLLNEIGELELGLQAKLLTFLDTRQFMRVGGERQVEVDVRIIAATNRDLEAEVSLGRFRKDLFYRLNVFQLTLPPLRERLEDLPVLTIEILEKMAQDMQMVPCPQLSADFLKTLRRYTWPGNIRELRNILERALMICDGMTLDVNDILIPQLSPAQSDWRLEVPFPDGQNLNDICNFVAKRIIEEALARTDTKTDAARLLGISRDALNHQMRKLMPRHQSIRS